MKMIQKYIAKDIVGVHPVDLFKNDKGDIVLWEDHNKVVSDLRNRLKEIRKSIELKLSCVSNPFERQTLEQLHKELTENTGSEGYTVFTLNFNGVDVRFVIEKDANKVVSDLRKRVHELEETADSLKYCPKCKIPVNIIGKVDMIKEYIRLRK